MKIIFLVVLFLGLNAQAAATLKCYSDNKASCKDGPNETQFAVPAASQGAQTDCCAVPTAKEIELTSTSNKLQNETEAFDSNTITE